MPKTLLQLQVLNSFTSKGAPLPHSSDPTEDKLEENEYQSEWGYCWEKCTSLSIWEQIGRRGEVEEDMMWREGETRKAAGTVKSLWKNDGLEMDAKRILYEGLVVPTAL